MDQRGSIITSLKKETFVKVDKEDCLWGPEKMLYKLLSIMVYNRVKQEWGASPLNVTNCCPERESYLHCSESVLGSNQC